MSYPQLGIFVDHKQLVSDTVDYCKFIRKVIPEFDVVIAIPRGGFFPASMVASVLGRPMSTPDQLVKGKAWWTSSNKVANQRTYVSTEYQVSIDASKAKVLLIDDISYNVMGTLERAKKYINKNKPEAKVFKTSLYCMERTKKSLDFYCKRISMNHWMEKDFLIRRRTQPMGFDIDGALCSDPTYWTGIAEEEWMHNLATASPFMIPHYKVEHLITARIERYRSLTEKWLEEHGVKYGSLHMMKDNTTVWGKSHVEYKSELVSRLLQGGIYVESNYNLAKGIYDRTKVQVICTETMELLGATDIGYDYHPAFNGYKQSMKHPLQLAPQAPPKKEKPTFLFH